MNRCVVVSLDKVGQSIEQIPNRTIIKRKCQPELLDDIVSKARHEVEDKQDQKVEVFDIKKGFAQVAHAFEQNLNLKSASKTDDQE